MPPQTESLIRQLQDCLGVDRVITDIAQRRLLSTDFCAEKAICCAAIRPADTDSLASAARIVTGQGFALIPRGGGMSYTGGYTPDSEATVVVDTADMTGAVAFDPADMTLSVRAGTTWESIYAFLKPHGLRLPFFGTFSGRRATVGGGLSNGAVFFGSALYGCAADNVIGLEVVCADGRILRTGQAASRNGKPFYRLHGPDLTGLFLHDCGALGIKTEATFRLIQDPTHQSHLSYAFDSAVSAAAALSATARSGAVEETYVFDPDTTKRNMDSGDLRSDVRRLGEIVRNQGGIIAGLKAGTRVVVAGKRVVPPDAYSLHLTCADHSESAVQARLERCRSILDDAGGTEIPNSIPLAVRAAPFDNLNGVLGPHGERWIALNAKVAHSDAAAIILGFDEMLTGYRARMSALDVTTSTLCTAVDTHVFGFEAVFHWPDQWLPMHRDVADRHFLAKFTESPANPDAAALIGELRRDTLQLFADLGAASNQIGRTYPYRDNLAPVTCELLDTLKAELDPANLMNPGVLGFN